MCTPKTKFAPNFFALGAQLSWLRMLTWRPGPDDLPVDVSLVFQLIDEVHLIIEVHLS